MLPDGSPGDRLGATPLPDGSTRFSVWAPRAERVEVVLEDRVVPLEASGHGYHSTVAQGEAPGSRYAYRLDGGPDRPDPASRRQPTGVHGPSEVVDLRFPWTDRTWEGLPLEDYVIYELHVGTFSPEGTFAGLVRHLDELADLGITAVELMPVASFPGARNWGYDGVCPFAVQESYGGPAGLAALVDACHARGLAVVLDVVYNHLGPEGNYLAEFGPYFTDRYRTPWGEAVNLDGPGSDEVRRFFVENALQWVGDYHVDALRLDAVHAIFDHSASPFLAELAEAVHRRGEASGRRCHVIAEDDRNDPRLVRSVDRGGLGLDAVWTDDFHHALHVGLTGERDGYYRDFTGVEDLERAWREGFAYQGEHSSFLGHRRGGPSRDLEAVRHVVFSQNHDQVGNRARGERLASLVPFEALQTAAAAVLLSPYLPLLFMGEEYGDTAPFLYFVDHSDPELLEAVRRGRREEFAGFHREDEPPDPADPETFHRSMLDHRLRHQGRHARLRELYRELLRLRRRLPALATPEKETQEVRRSGDVLWVRRRHAAGDALVVLNLGGEPATLAVDLPGCWAKLLDPDGGLPDEVRPPTEVRLASYAVGVYLEERAGPPGRGAGAHPESARPREGSP